ncbi:Lsr2 protein [Streptomyces sp. BK022]|uniref:Lsr2 dimerization domain-containing protein n=1 Tax=Streptomyces sp. BK022 TaxID=2512123 RepID=UPI0010DE8DDD|nr:histone-like nucleoid-structuring protein Lsr2 [Streptomyces sp. BK022]RZU36038.1 Lsr2 protein [Streptomyces sp. BK022]
MGERVRKFCDRKVKRGRKAEVCGQDVPNDESTVFQIGTTRYEADLCQEHQDEMLEAMEPYTSIAHTARKRVGTQVRKAIQGKGGQAFTAQDVRQWLREERGYDVPDTGRLTKAWIEEFEAAHQ